MTRTTRIVLRHPRAAIAAWSVTMLLLAVAGLDVKDRLALTTFDIPGTGSYASSELVREGFDGASFVPVLLKGPEAEVDRQGKRLVARIRMQRGFAVLSPWDSGDASRGLRPSPRAALIVPSGRATEEESFYAALPPVEQAVRREIKPPVRAHVTGQAAIGRGLNEATLEATEAAERLAIPVLLIVLLLVFRSPVAAAIPGAVGLITVLSGAGAIALLARVVPIDAISTSLASMMGLALGVDYALLMISRFREEMRAGSGAGAAADAAAGAALTAGRTVLFAGVTLIAAMAVALLLSPGTVLLSAAAGVIAVTTLSVLAAVTFVPPLLLLLGPNLERWRLGRRPAGGPGLASRWSERMTARPGLAALLCLLGLLVLTLPVLGLSAAPPDVPLLPADNKARQDFEEVKAVAGPGYGAPLEVTVASREGAITSRRSLREMDRFQEAIARDPGVAAVAGPGSLNGQTAGLRGARTGIARAQRSLRRGSAGLDRLGDGTRRAARGVSDVRDGLAAASVAAGQLAQGSAATGDGSRALTGGLDEARVGATALGAGLDRARRGSDELLAGLWLVSEGARRLESSIGATRAGAARLAPALGTARRAAADELAPGATELADSLAAGSAGLGRLREPARTATSEVSEAFEALTSMTVGAADPNYLRAVTAAGRASAALTGTDPVTGQQIDPDYGGLEPELGTAQRGLSEAAGETRRLAAGIGELAAGLGRAEAGSRQVESALRQLEDGAVRLAGALGATTAGSEDLSRGLRRLTEGAQPLADGVGELGEGSEELSDGIAAVTDGAGRVAQAMREGTRRSQPLEDGLGGADRAIVRFRDDLNGMRRQPLLRGASRSPRLYDSSYFTLAALDGARAADRSPVSALLNLSGGGSIGRILIVPRTGPTSPATAALIDRLGRAADGLTRRGKLQAEVGGAGTAVVEYDEIVSGRVPIIIAALSAITFLVLVPLLRALLMPLVAVLLNLLTVGAAFGVLALLFTGASPPLGGPGFLDILAIVGIFTVIFGLSIDYEVFLLCRVREEFVARGDPASAISVALVKTAPVITGAAAIMTGVFLSFALTDFVAVRQFGVGLAAAVIIDATIVRLVLLPAAMRLLGRSAWWLPAWLDRLLPDVDLERSRRPLPGEAR